MDVVDCTRVNDVFEDGVRPSPVAGKAPYSPQRIACFTSPRVASLTPLYTAPVIAYRRGVPICVLTHVSIKCVLPHAGRIFSHTIGDAAHAPQRRACLLSPYGFAPVALRVGLSVV
eukprot:scaffold39028_cov65-Phaeocystis_antarctica.AAC.7